MINSKSISGAALVAVLLFLEGGAHAQVRVEEFEPNFDYSFMSVAVRDIPMGSFHFYQNIYVNSDYNVIFERVDFTLMALGSNYVSIAAAPTLSTPEIKTLNVLFRDITNATFAGSLRISAPVTANAIHANVYINNTNSLHDIGIYEFSSKDFDSTDSIFNGYFYDPNIQRTIFDSGVVRIMTTNGDIFNGKNNSFIQMGGVTDSSSLYLINSGFDSGGLKIRNTGSTTGLKSYIQLSGNGILRLETTDGVYRSLGTIIGNLNSDDTIDMTRMYNSSIQAADNFSGGLNEIIGVKTLYVNRNAVINLLDTQYDIDIDNNYGTVNVGRNGRTVFNLFGDDTVSTVKVNGGTLNILNSGIINNVSGLDAIKTDLLLSTDGSFNMTNLTGKTTAKFKTWTGGHTTISRASPYGLRLGAWLDGSGNLSDHLTVGDVFGQTNVIVFNKAPTYDYIPTGINLITHNGDTVPLASVFSMEPFIENDITYKWKKVNDSWFIYTDPKPTIVEIEIEIEKIVERLVTVEVPVEVIREVIREVIKEVPVEVERIVYIDKIVEVIKEIPVEVIKVEYVEVIKEIIREIPIEVIKEIIKEVPIEVIKEIPVEVIKEVPVEIIKEIIKEVPVEVIKEIPFEVIREVIKEVPVEVIKVEYIEVIKEIIKEIPVEVIKEVRVEVIKEIIKEVIKEVPVEVIKEVIKEVPIEIIREVPIEIIREIIREIPIEVIKEVPVIIIKEVPVEIIKEIIKEVPIEIIKEIPVEVFKEVIKEVIKEVHIEVPVEVIKVIHVEVIKEVIKEIIKEVPIEIIKEIPVEIIKEVPIIVIKEIIKEVIKEVPIEIIKEIPVEVIKEVPIEIIKEIIKEVPIEIIKEIPVEVIKEVKVEVIKEIIKEVPIEVIKEVFVEIIKEVPVEVLREMTKEELEALIEEIRESLKSEAVKPPEVIPPIIQPVKQDIIIPGSDLMVLDSISKMKFINDRLIDIEPHDDIWVSINRNHADFAGTKSKLDSVTIGVDRVFNDKIQLGGFVSHSVSDFSKTGWTQGDYSSVHYGLYTRYSFDNQAFIQGVVDWSRNSITYNNYPGSHDGRGLSSSVLIGKTGTSGNLSLTPYFGLTYHRAKGYTINESPTVRWLTPNLNINETRLGVSSRISNDWNPKLNLALVNTKGFKSHSGRRDFTDVEVDLSFERKNKDWTYSGSFKTRFGKLKTNEVQLAVEYKW